MAYTEAVHVPGKPVAGLSTSKARARWRRRFLTGLGLCALTAEIGRAHV